jgi:hypothetical protein
MFYAEGIGWVPFDVMPGPTPLPNPDDPSFFGYNNPAQLPRMLDFDFRLPLLDKGKSVEIQAVDAFAAVLPRGEGTLDGLNTKWSGFVRVSGR